MKIDLSQFRQTYLQESAEHVESMENDLLALRSAPNDVERLNAIFRSAHSIKGGAGSFGLNHLMQFTHALESLLDCLRALEVPATAETIALLLQAVDVLRALLLAEPESSGIEYAMPEQALLLMQRFDRLVKPSRTEDSSATEPEAGRVTFYEVDFRPHRAMFSSGTNPIMLLRNLAVLGTVSVCRMHADDLPPLGMLDPQQCYLRWTLEVASSHPEETLREVFEFVEHLADLQVRPLAVRAAMQPGKVTSKTATVAETSSIRVATDKVDRLIDLVGELVIAQVMTSQMVEDFELERLPKLRDAVAAMERSTRELHERVMAVRMMPVGPLFQRYVRVLYDISKANGKQMRLETSGEETEIDRSMLDLLGDPLTHLVRNAADHGIEARAVRLAAGKAEEGVIRMRAFHRAGRVVMEISDDGAGIDTARVRAKALERGLIDVEAELSDDQIQMLIFEPGFSTREAVSDLSGRGVGMDVVKRNVQQLSGTVAVASVLGEGSTVSIELPLTLAILEGLLVRVADRTLVLPLLVVMEAVSLRTHRIRRIAEQGEVIVIREESIPVLRLRRFLGVDPASTDALEGIEAADNRLVVVVEAGRKKIGLVVDDLMGQQQVVVKSLEKHLQKVRGLMGATILGDGRVAPILDVASLAELNLFSIVSRGGPRPLASSVLPLPASGKGAGIHELV